MRTTIPAVESWWARVLDRPNLLGVVLATWLAAQSMTPSLLVRSWLFQGVLTGIAIALGYGIGVALTRLARWLWTRRRVPGGTSGTAAGQRVRWVVLALCLGWATWAALEAVDTHRWTWERLGYARSSYWLVFGGALLLAVVVALVLLGVARLLALVWRATTRAGSRVLPTWIAGTLALVLVGWAVLASLNTFVLERTLDGFNGAFALGDRDLDGPPRRRRRGCGPAARSPRWCGRRRAARVVAS